MRAWLSMVCLPLLLTGCMAGANGRTAAPGDPGAVVLVPAPSQGALSKALASYAHGLLLEHEEGPDSQAALAAYQQAFQADPGNHDLASRVAVVALKRHAPQTAIDALKASYAVHPQDYRRTVDLAAVYQATAHAEDAVVFYRRALSIDDTPTAVYIALPGILFQNDRDAEALAVVEEGHRKADEPHLIGVYLYDQARRFVAHGSFDRAIPCLELLRTWDEVRKPDIHLLMAELYLAADRGNEAIRILQEAVSLPEPPPDVFTALALAALNLGHAELAGTVLAEACERFPESPDALFMIGAVFAEMGRHAQTVDLLLRVMRMTEQTALQREEPPPALSEAFYLHLGASYERLGRHADAEAIFRQCLAIYPDSHRVMNYLAYMWAEENRELETALKYSVRSLVLAPNNGAYTDTLGWIYYRMAQYELALETLNKARLLAGDDPEILLHLGDTMAALGDLESAATFWRQSIEGDPSDANRAAEQLRLHGSAPPAKDDFR